MKARSSARNNYTTVTTNNHNGTQTERTFQSREERQNWLKTRGIDFPPNIPHGIRTVERTGGDED